MAIKKWVPAVVLAGVMLAGCGQSLAGSAAVVGEARLTDAQLSQTVGTLSERLGIGQSAQVSQAVLSRWVVAQLVDQLAARKGVAVSKGDIDATIATEQERAGGAEAFESGALQAGVLPEDIPGAVRTSLLIERLSEATVTDEDPSGQTGLLAEIQSLNADLAPQISPRFGTWDAEQLSVGALPDDLSAPAAPALDPLAQLQQQAP